MSLDLGPYHTHKVVCSYCGRLMMDGTGETIFGCCVLCADRINKQQERERMRNKRRVDRKGPAEERWPDEEVFAGFMEEE
ncbi:MAG TPA: hypothetical protein VM537_25820 [Anaerolineae bacterium]|nr:hypothetical protein [Anaerolineae bacterium]